MGVLSLMNKPAKKNGKRIPRSIYNPCPDEVRVTPHSRVPRSLLLLILPRPSPEGAESQGPFFAFFARRSWSPHDINRSIFTSPFFSFFFFFWTPRQKLPLKTLSRDGTPVSFRALEDILDPRGRPSRSCPSEGSPDAACVGPITPFYHARIYKKKI